MSRSSTTQRTGPYRLPLLSASQVKQTGCWRRWGFSRLEGRREPMGDAASRGTAHHAEMEAWSLHGILPTSKPALSALWFAPPKGLGAGIEVPVRFDTPHSPWIGYIDACFDWDGENMKELGSTGWTVIQDYKFTGSLRNAKEAHELLEDEAANIYAYEAFLGGAERVSGRWVYVQMNGAASRKIVWFDFNREDVFNFVADLDATTAKEIQAHYSAHRSGDLKVLDLPYDTGQCYAFRQQCPFMSDCKPETKISLQGAAPMQDFKDAILSGFPGGSVPPPVKAAPKLPPKLPPKSLSAPERGFVNPPEAPKVAASSPEHAAELQGIPKPAPAPTPAFVFPSEVDPLDVMSRDQLKAMAVSMGLVPENSRAREPVLRETIRAARGSEPTALPPTAVPAAELDVDYEGIAADYAEGMEKYIKPAVVEPTPPKEADDVDYCGSIGFPDPSTEEEPETVAVEPARFTLYINCAPTVNVLLHMRDVLEHANAIIKKVHGVDDYRLVEYGKGAGCLCIAVRMMKEEGYFDRFPGLIVDSRTPEGLVLLETLSGMATEIVRGF